VVDFQTYRHAGDLGSGVTSKQKTFQQCRMYFVSKFSKVCKTEFTRPVFFFTIYMCLLMYLPTMSGVIITDKLCSLC